MSSLLTVSEVAEQLKCKGDLVRSLIARGKLRAVSLSEKRKCYRVRQEWVDEFLNSDTTIPSVSGPRKPKIMTTQVLRKIRSES